MKKNNLVFLMTDHQRADSIHMIQDGKEITPNLNKLAKESTEFARVYDACPLCVPARTALATGKNPIKSGMILNDVPGAIAQNHKTIHEYFNDMGYDVAHVGVHHIRVKPDLKERLDFKLWIDEDSYNEYADSKGIDIKRDNANTTMVDEMQEGQYVKFRYSNAKCSVWNNEFEDFKDVYFTRKAVEFLQEEHSRPFALFLYLWAPHPPLNVPEPYASKFNPNNLDLPNNVKMPSKGEPAIRRKGIAAQLAEGISIGEWKKIWATHLGLVNMADAQIGLVLDTLKEKGLMDDTAIVFTSDHGEHLGQHDMYQKMEMYEPAVRVPAIMKIPGGKTQIIKSAISHLDFLPTLLDVMGKEADQEFEGTSLKNCIMTGEDEPEKDIFSVYCGNHKKGDIRRAVISSKYKYIYDSTEEAELYDLEKDPLEMDNLALNEKYAGILKEMHDKCKTWGANYGDYISY